MTIDPRRTAIGKKIGLLLKEDKYRKKFASKNIVIVLPDDSVEYLMQMVSRYSERPILLVTESNDELKMFHLI